MKDEKGDRPADLKLRTKQFALRIIELFSAMPKTAVAQIIGKQMLRSGTSVGAHYREAIRSRSKAEFISKIGGGLQETRKRPTGWNSPWNPAYLRLIASRILCRKLMN